MTKPNNTYSVVLKKDDSKPAILQQLEMKDSILDMADVFCESGVEVSEDPVTKCSKLLTLTLHCNETFAAEVKNTVGVATVKKSPVPHCAPACHHC